MPIADVPGAVVDDNLGRQLIDDALSLRSPSHGRSEIVTRAIGGQSVIGKPSDERTCENMKDGFSPFPASSRTKFKSHTTLALSVSA